MSDEILSPADQLRKEAKESRERAYESFERCDTDGFLSQWASNTVAREKEIEANLLDQGGKAEFQVLMDMDGNIMPAKRINNRYGSAWAFFENPNNIHSRLTGVFINEANSPKLKTQAAALARKGYKLGVVKAPAYVESGGSRINITYFYARSGKDPLADIEIISTDFFSEQIKKAEDKAKKQQES